MNRRATLFAVLITHKMDPYASILEHYGLSKSSLTCRTDMDLVLKWSANEEAISFQESNSESSVYEQCLEGFLWLCNSDTGNVITLVWL
jgi:hypothetical protein